MFTNADQAVSHLSAGAERVLVTALSKGADVTLVVGVNEHSYDPAEHQIITAASCTTNALALIAKVLHERFGVCYGMMNTIHAYTNDQRILDEVIRTPGALVQALKTSSRLLLELPRL